MREMRDSGIEWIGEIPSDWKVERLQWHIKEIKEGNNPQQTTSVLSLTNKLGVIPYEEKGAQGNVAKEDCTQYKLAYPNTIVANSMNILIGSVGLCKYFGCVSPVYYVYKPDCGENLYFLNYIFQLHPFQKELRRYAKGIMEIRLRVSSDDILKRLVAFPSPNEQERIVKALDKKCSQVDALIANQEAQIEKLKAYKQSLITEVVTKGLDSTAPMKDSGVEWIGEMPSHWTLQKLIQLCSRTITYGIVKLGDHDDDGIKVLRCSDVREGYIDESNIRTVTHELSNEYKRTVLKGNEVVVNVRGSLGGCAVVPTNMAGYNIAREVAMVAVEKCNPHYVKYFLLSKAFEKYREYYLAGSVYVGLNIDLLNRFQVPMFDEQEQDAIVKYLDEKCSHIDRLIDIKKAKIEKLNEYKK